MCMHCTGAGAFFVGGVDLAIGPDGTAFVIQPDNVLGQAGSEVSSFTREVLEKVRGIASQTDVVDAYRQAETQPEAGFMSEEEAADFVASRPAGTVFIDGLMTNWDDLSSEAYRTYVYPDGIEYTIVGPMLLNVSESGTHRIFDDSGHSHWVRGDFTAITWRAKPGKPNFVK